MLDDPTPAGFTITDTPNDPDALPDLVVHGGNLPATVRALRIILADAGDLFDRGGVAVRLVTPSDGGQPVAHRLTSNAVVMEAHKHCRPVKVDSDGKRHPVTLTERAAKMWVETRDWNLPMLAGITGAPVLAEDGTILTTDGYDSRLGLWCKPPPALAVPDRPTRANASAALLKLRSRFATFPFRDSPMLHRDALDVVDLTKLPGMAESCCLAALLTAVCRPSLRTAPGLLISAPDVTGAGSGKGLLVRAICAIAFGMQPGAFTSGHDRHELDKRLVAELIGAAPAVFLDNVNATSLRSDTLASVLTENPARVRLMGVSQMVPLNCTAFIALTGNGLTVSEDLARRIISVDLDPRCEDPEGRPFPQGFLGSVENDRAELLSACLTILRWGRQSVMPSGLPLGSFEVWAAWCRDPLLALGCQDPVQRIRDAKATDPKRQFIANLFSLWWQHHKGNPIQAAKLAEPVLVLLNPQGRTRHYVAQRLVQLNGTRGAGFVLTQQAPGGKWGAYTYALAPITAADGQEHRTHRTHGANASTPDAPMTPMGPMGAPLCDEGPGEAEGEL
jgi:hypothetical protein